MDFKNSITLTSNKTKFMIPVEYIINVFEMPNGGYSSDKEKTKTCIAIQYDNVTKMGLLSILNRYNEVSINHGLFLLEVEEEFKLVAALLKGDKAAKVLYE
jgi:hypothetical protein